MKKSLMEKIDNMVLSTLVDNSQYDAVFVEFPKNEEEAVERYAKELMETLTSDIPKAAHNSFITIESAGSLSAWSSIKHFSLIKFKRMNNGTDKVVKTAQNLTYEEASNMAMTFKSEDADNENIFLIEEPEDSEGACNRLTTDWNRIFLVQKKMQLKV